MQHADTLTVVHHNDARTEFTNVRYALDGDVVRVATEAGEVVFTESLRVQATKGHAKK